MEDEETDIHYEIAFRSNDGDRWILSSVIWPAHAISKLSMDAFIVLRKFDFNQLDILSNNIPIDER